MDNPNKPTASNGGTPSQPTQNLQLGWIGLGNMGRGMCKNLVQKGQLDNPLLIYNRTKSRATDLSQAIGNSTVAPSITDLVQKSDIIFYCLGDDQSVFETLDEITKVPLKGKVLVDCSTIHPDSTTKEEEMVTKASGTFVAMPVFGAPPMADAGQLVCVLAGSGAGIRQIRPYLKGVMGRAEIDYSNQPARKATLLKIIGNTFVLSMVETLAEGHTLAEKSGLGTQELHALIATMFPGPFTAYSNRMLTGDYYKREDPLFAVDLARKDARHAQKLAESQGMRMKIVEVADGHLADVKAHVGERGDIAAIYGAKRKEAGLKYENGT